MYKCKYCGRYLKNNYNNCPGCGSINFEKVNIFGVTKITQVPQGGYQIKTSNLKRSNFLGILFAFIGGIFTLMGLVMAFLMGFLILFSLFGLIFLVIGLWLIKMNNDKVKKVERLAFTGVLIKNLNYELKKTGNEVMGVPVYAIEVIYENETGVKIPLRSEPKYDGVLSRNDGTVDLLIDPNDISNYFIDFEIY